MFKAINGWTKSNILKVLKARRYNAPAVEYGTKCIYVTSNGNKCAIGMFIPKGHEGFKVNGNVKTLLEEYPDLKSILPLTDIGLKELQNSHDDCSRYDKDEKGYNAKEAMIEWVKKNVA